MNIGDTQAWESRPCDPNRPIEVGDWAKSRLCGVVVGEVVRLGVVQLGRKWLPVVVVRMANGKEEGVLTEDAVLLGYG